MNCFSQVSTYTRAIFRRTTFVFAASTSIHGCFNPYWTSTFHNVAVNDTVLDSLCSRFRLRCYSSRKNRKAASPSPKFDSEPPPMEPEKGDFFVVRKGDVLGVYKSFSDCQAQIGTSICDLPVSVFKGHSLPKDTEEYLASVGLKNALYTIKAADMRPDLFGSLVPCTFHDGALKGEASGQDAIKKRSRESILPENIGSTVLTPTSKDPTRKHVKLEDSIVSRALSSNRESCFLEFDGASKGNPGQAGAGAVLRAHDGSVICRLREGLGIATNNVAEYRAILLGLKYALQKGFTRIHVQGDSKLVCMQVQGLWRVKNENISELCDEVIKLKDRFLSFEISHVLRNLNSEADAQANLAITLADGEVKEFEE